MSKKLSVAAFAVVVGLAGTLSPAYAAPSDAIYDCVAAGPWGASAWAGLTAEGAAAFKAQYKALPHTKVNCKKE